MGKNFYIFSCFLLISINTLNAQDKPRKFIKQTVLCPIDYLAFQSFGLSQSTITIIVDTVTLKPGDQGSANLKLIRDSIYKRTDTIYNYSVVASKNLAFEIIQNVGSYSIIKLWEYDNTNYNEDISVLKQYSNSSYSDKKNKQNIIFNKRYEVSTSSQKYINPSLDYFLVKTEDLLNKSLEFEYLKNSWNVGLMYLPIKIRPFATTSGMFDFTSDLSIGTSFSWTIKHNFINDWTINMLIYTGVSSIKIDRRVSGDSSYSTNAQNVTAFSPAFGFYWEKKGIQLGFATGLDFLAGNLQKTWVYRGMPWLSLTAGINIFRLTNNANVSQQKTQ